jgi:hypothetical protein
MNDERRQPQAFPVLHSAFIVLTSYFAFDRCPECGTAIPPAAAEAA